MMLRCLAQILTPLALVALSMVLVLPPPAQAGAGGPTKKTVTYLVTLTLDSTLVVGPFSSTENVTANIVANPVGTDNDPTAWEGNGTLTFGPIQNSGLPGGCELVIAPPSGSMKTGIVKSGDNIDVTWSSNTTPVTAGVITCQGQAAPFFGGAPPEPFLLLEPKQFTIPASGGSQELRGKLSTGKGIMENVGTMTVTRREACGEKVKEVNTYPPGQTTSASSMVGRAFGVGEKVTADTNVEFVFEDGSIARLAKGASIAQDAKCESFTDKSKSYKGTLLLGLIWSHVTKAVGGEQKVYQAEPCVPPGGLACVAGVRGTTFWFKPGTKATTLSVSEGSVWLSHAKDGKLTGKRIIVRKNQTAVITKTLIRVRKLTPKDAFPFG